jgi:hypothetical protein
MTLIFFSSTKIYLKYMFNVQISFMRTVAPAKNASPSNVSLTPHSSETVSLPRKYQAFRLVPWLMPVGAIAVIYYRLRPLRAETLSNIAGGFSVVVGALLGLGIFLWCIRWGVSHDGNLK